MTAKNSNRFLRFVQRTTSPLLSPVLPFTRQIIAPNYRRSNGTKAKTYIKSVNGRSPLLPKKRTQRIVGRGRRRKGTAQYLKWSPLFSSRPTFFPWKIVDLPTADKSDRNIGITISLSLSLWRILVGWFSSPAISLISSTAQRGTEQHHPPLKISAPRANR